MLAATTAVQQVQQLRSQPAVAPFSAGLPEWLRLALRILLTAVVLLGLASTWWQGLLGLVAVGVVTWLAVGSAMVPLAVRGAVDASLLGDDPPSFVPFSLTPTQQLIGAAIVGPLHRGRARRPGYAEVAAASNYSERTVREAVAAMDGLFVLHRLADPDGPSDALDRVAQALRLHSALLGGD